MLRDEPLFGACDWVASFFFSFSDLVSRGEEEWNFDPLFNCICRWQLIGVALEF